MRIAIGADHGGYPLNERVIEELRGAGHEITDFGTHDERMNPHLSTLLNSLPYNWSTDSRDAIPWTAVQDVTARQGLYMGIEFSGRVQIALQAMLMQCEGRKILLLPAWPKDWDAEFRLHAPLRTVVEGRVRGGKLSELRVTPEERRADVVVCG